MIVESLVILLVYLGGCAAVRAAGVRGWGLPPLGFVTGVCLLLGVGFVQVATGLPTTPAITLAVVAAAPVAWWVVRWRRGGDVAVSVPLAVGGAALVVGAVAVARDANLLKWHPDSIAYLMAGRLLAEGDYRSTASTELLATRVFGVPLLHAPADLGGELYLRSVTPLLAAATILAVVWFLGRAGLDRRRFVVAAGLAVLLLLTSNRVVFSFFYLNGHLLYAACVLLVAAGGWLLATHPDRDARALMTMQLVAIPGLVVTRPEGFLSAALVLLPTLLSARLPRHHRATVLAVYGGTSLLLGAFQIWFFLDRDSGLPASAAGAAALGAAALAAIPLLARTPAQRRAGLLLLGAEAALWLALAALAARDPETLWTSLRALYRNQVEGVGGYGLSLTILTALLLLAWLLSPRLPHQAHLRFPLTTFVPFCLVMAYLREGAYRAADADSMNRMLIHVVPLAVLFLFALLTLTSEDTGKDPRPEATAAPPEPATAIPTRA
ncbi:hypothetical protein [Phytohabitans suffuscus]|uniref:Glycosyltransferase RgtA/B/C/D-like domain-containing protein n=1 Tax=Phytohabitans suffuscus TaxID=624315 RepID=A0A6F8YWM0_9ACTN|nr:hypothetical protein [Phytohabitans suffuscus]BCB90492.1 hypothetical protein Psuf_078050 [Phytohabitans suffuscus]